MAEDVTIPAHFQVVKLAGLEHSRDMDKKEQRKVESDRIFFSRQHLLGGSVLATARCATVPVLLINSLQEDEQLRQNTTVGHFNPTPLNSDRLYLPMSTDEQDDLPTSPWAATGDFRKDINLLHSDNLRPNRRTSLTRCFSNLRV